MSLSLVLRSLHAIHLLNQKDKSCPQDSFFSLIDMS